MKINKIKWKCCLLLTVLPFFACHTQQEVQAQEGTIMAEELIKKLGKGKALYFENAVIEGDIYLSDALQSLPFNALIQVSYIDAPLVFANCRFKGKFFAQRPTDSGMMNNRIIFTKHVRLENCSFEGETSFEGSQFMGDCNFAGSSFEATTNFDNTSFQGLASFQNANFLGPFNMQNSVFLRDLIMSKASFKDHSAFQGNVYHLAARFTEASFLKYADFSNQDFRSGVYFTYAQFQERSTFGYSRFLSSADFNRLRFGDNASFKGCTFFGKTRFNASEYRKQLELSKVRYLGEPAEMKEMVEGPDASIIQE